MFESHSRRARRSSRGLRAALALGLLTSEATAAPLDPQPFTDHRNPPSYRKLSEAEFARYDTGMAVFNTHFVIAGTPNAGRLDGLGPLFNSSSCDSCHNNGARGRGPTGDGPAPESLVIQLTAAGARSRLDPEGDPVYGRVFNPIALDGVPAEGEVVIHYDVRQGHYPDGTVWNLRVPHYELTQLHYGPVAPGTIVKPRLAPALFGAGLLDAVNLENGDGESASLGVNRPAMAGNRGPRDATDVPTPRPALTLTGAGSGNSHDPSDLPTLGAAATLPGTGRFGWQATATSVRDQTARAFAREMGLTSTGIPSDDCTPAETACLQQPNGGSPEVSADLFDAVLSFQHWLAVPASPTPHPDAAHGEQIFAELGCIACHRPQWPVTLTDAGGNPYGATITPYTDLRRHNLGPGLADQTVAGQKVLSRWRTAPLWALGYRLSLERFPTFLHDGRARSAEESILWHDGEAAGARKKFEHLTADQRKAFLRWLETL